MHVVQHLSVGGLEKLVLSLLTKSNYRENSIIVSLEGSKEEVIAKWPELRVVSDKLFFIEKTPKFSFGVVEKLHELAQSQHIDVIHSHHIGPILYSSLTCMRAKHLKHVSTIHDAWYLTQLKYRLMTKLFHYLHPIYWVADAQVVANDFGRLTNITPQQTILNGIDCKKFCEINQELARYNLGLNKKAKLLGCAARLEPGKGHGLLLKQFASLPDDWQLVLAGQGSLRAELENLARDLNIHKRVIFLGNVSDMVSFYSAIDVFCLLSEKEGLPLSILESIACNTPVIATAVGGIPEIITEDNGILVQSTSLNRFYDYVQSAKELKAHRNMRNFVMQNAELATMARSYDQLYQNL
jgi:glycosyltransferase involved in cell wall biosynthesis